MGGDFLLGRGGVARVVVVDEARGAGLLQPLAHELNVAVDALVSEVIQKGTRVRISLCDSLMFGPVPKNAAVYCCDTRQVPG